MKKIYYVIRYRIISFNDIDVKKVNLRNLKPNTKVFSKTNRFSLIMPENIPTTHNIDKYGIFDGFDSSGNKIFINYKNPDIKYIVKDSSKNNIINRDVDCYFKDNIFISYKDIISNSNIFERFIQSLNVYYYLDKNTSLVLYSEKPIKSKSLKQAFRDPYKNEKISVFDIECFINKNNLFIPFACGWYSYLNNKQKVKKSKSCLYYITDFSSVDEMFIKCFKDLIKINPGVVYVHNLSKFDSFFINKILFENFNVNAKYKGRLILSLNVKYNEDGKTYKMIFKDSLLLLQGSLKYLGKTYNVETKKSLFPYSFPNEDNLNYIGDKPDFKFYSNDDNNVSIDDYNSIPKDNWNLKDETFKYLINDLHCTYQILEKFTNIIYNGERIDVTKVSTISSLSFKIIKANYLPLNKLYQINGQSHKDIRNAYIGGRVDSFTPFGENIKCYDVNSLYPFAMLNPLPGGQAKMSNDTNLENYFGVVYAKISTPTNSNGDYINLKYPPLPFKCDNGSLINPIGCWEGWYFSEELKYVRDNHAYKIDVKHGYKFTKEEGLFNDLFINIMI
uniref:Probable DNA polymerase n=2 Tax=Orbilia oligospora TaxID=2813651 RepID=A0A481ZKZ8_ORBOL|nr:hypothetical protein [Orbilia oligospora]QBL02019.1 hypothetical protein [Orbilia oligospora]